LTENVLIFSVTGIDSCHKNVTRQLLCVQLFFKSSSSLGLKQRYSHLEMTSPV